MLQEFIQIVEVLKSDEVQALIDEGATVLTDIIAKFLQKAADSEITDACAAIAANYVAALEKNGFTREEAVAMACNFMNTLAAQARSSKSK